MKFYLSGQTDFGNRGCEALVRGTADMIRSEIPEARILCPLSNISQDGAQWPDADAAGVDFVASPLFSKGMRWWARANRLLPLEARGLPPFRNDAATDALVSDASALIMTGGDILTLDYGVMSLYQWCRLNENVMNAGVPAILWAASVGPFSARPGVERVMAEHLRRYAAITVRETVSLEYLRSIGVEHAELVADPAFHLAPSIFDCQSLVGDGGRPVLGFNVSPLIRKFRQGDDSAASMDRDIQQFLADTVLNSDLRIVLIPHVGALDGSEWNSDWHYMQGILSAMPGAGERVVLAPPTLNAAQLKYLISRCQYFIGARTHSTIAALSQGVPTVSIAYSIKAKGINQDLFGHLRYVLETPRVSAVTLSEALRQLQLDSDAIRQTLASRVPEWRLRAKKSVSALMRVARMPSGAIRDLAA